MKKFSSINRSHIVNEALQQSFDLIVIGGGITGAGIALDACSRGLKVLLLEAQDFASGTSGKSTKLVHGGLRYLKQLELRLVAEVGKEREIVHRNAPHLTKPEKMLLPIIRNGSLGKLSARVGMWMYEWLAGVKQEEWHQVLSKEKALAAEPLLDPEKLLAGILFYEYKTDDARLCIEVLKQAVDKGVYALSYMKVLSFLYREGKIYGVNALDVLSNTEHQFTAPYFVNAGGPWVDAIDDLDQQQNTHKLHITKGIHIVVDAKKLPVKQALYFDTFDKRMIFVIPREGKVYIGTTDTFYEGDLRYPDVSLADKNYLLKCVNTFFSSTALELSDIESVWAGVRPLVNKPGKGPSEISRKDEMFFYPSGLLTIAGGKLTGYRKMAQRVVDKIAALHVSATGKRLPACNTANISLSGGTIPAGKKFSDFLKEKTEQALRLGISAEEAKNLVYRFGSNIDQVFSIFITIQQKPEPGQLPALLEAQLLYCIDQEMCMSPSDFLIRRTGYLYFHIDQVKAHQFTVLERMAVLLNWNNEQKDWHLANWEKDIQLINAIRS